MLRVYDYIYFRIRQAFEGLGKKDAREKACAVLSITEGAVFMDAQILISWLYSDIDARLSVLGYVGVASCFYGLNLVRYYKFYKPDKLEPAWNSEPNAIRIAKGWGVLIFVAACLFLVPIGSSLHG
jgi:hypothetical protein